MLFRKHIPFLLVLPLFAAAYQNIDAARVARAPDILSQLLGTDPLVPATGSPSASAPASASASPSGSSPGTTTPSATPSQSSPSASPSPSNSLSNTLSAPASPTGLNTTSAAPSTTPPPSTTAPSATPTPTTQTITTTNAQGSVIVVTQTVTAATSNTAAADASASSPSSSSTSVPATGSTQISSSTIIGLSVAGGVAVMGLVAFIIWKFTRKRFAGFDDYEADAIKWPELRNDDTAMAPLPARPTGGAGIETSAYEHESEFDAASVTGASTTDLVNPVTYAAPPYSRPVPGPIPPPVPGQQYFDDPNAAYGQAYYDPYRGAVPGSMGYGGPPGRTTSPGPQRGLSMSTEGGADSGSVYNTARSRSPGPGQALGGGEMGERMRSPPPQLPPQQNLGLANP